MAGTSGNTFSPDVTTTRGMLVTILWRLAGSPNMENEIWGYPFKNVDANAYYATAVYWARMNGIVAGYSDELFGPNDTITREQMAAILYRYAQHKGYDTTTKADLSKYTDAAQVGSYAVDAIQCRGSGQRYQRHHADPQGQCYPGTGGGDPEPVLPAHCKVNYAYICIKAFAYPT